MLTRPRATQRAQAIQHLGITIMAFTTLVATCHFPMWGSMFFPPQKSALDSGVISPEARGPAARGS